MLGRMCVDLRVKLSGAVEVIVPILSLRPNPINGYWERVDLLVRVNLIDLHHVSSNLLSGSFLSFFMILKCLTAFLEIVYAHCIKAMYIQARFVWPQGDIVIWFLLVDCGYWKGYL